MTLVLTYALISGFFCPYLSSISHIHLHDLLAYGYLDKTVMKAGPCRYVLRDLLPLVIGLVSQHPVLPAYSRARHHDGISTVNVTRSVISTMPRSFLFCVLIHFFLITCKGI